MNSTPGPGNAARGWKAYYEGQSQNVEFGAVVIGDLTLNRGSAIKMAANSKVLVHTQSNYLTDASNIYKYITRQTAYGQTNSFISGSKTDYSLLSWEEVGCRIFDITYSEQRYRLSSGEFIPDGEPLIHTITKKITEGYTGECRPCTDQDDDGLAVEGGDCGPIDCNDSNPAISPGATEVCDDLDNNCDGNIDEGLSVDADNDGHFPPDACSTPRDDCNDNEARVHPGALEICGDGLDNDCNPATPDACCNLKIEDDFTGPADPLDPNSGQVAKISATISGSSGKPVKWVLTILGKEFEGSGEDVSVLWDGKDADGRIPEPGEYPATLKAETEDGSCSDEATLAVHIKEENGCLSITFGSQANLASGNLSHSLPLFSATGTGPAADLTLSYNSLDPYAGSLGLGWSISFDMFLTTHADGSVVLKKGNGKQLLYTPSTAGYLSQRGDYAVLHRNDDHTFTRIEKDGTASHFDQDGRLARIEDRNNNVLALAYTDGLLATITDATGRVTTFAYDANGKLAAITDPAGSTYAMAVAGNRLLRATDPAGGTWGFSYDGQGFLTARTDPRGFTTTYGYDDQHRVSTATDPEGRVRRIDYPVLGTEATKTALVTEKDGSLWRYTYDSVKGDLIEKEDPLGGVTKYVYNDNHNLLSKTEPDGSTTTSTYDQAGNQTSSTDPLGQVTVYTYNEFGQTTGITDVAGDTTSFSYDGHGNLLAVTDPAGSTTSYRYDGAGRVIAITNPLGERTTLAYDPSGNLASVTDSVGATTSYAYDAAGRMISQTDSLARTTTFAYDAAGNMVKMTDPDGNATTFSYDAEGNKSSQTDANGHTIRYQYNYQGQLTQTTDAVGGVTTSTYGGNPGCSSCGEGSADKLTALTDANGNTTLFRYDALGRLVAETDPLGNVTQYGYDAKGNRISRTDGDGNTLTYVYDPLGRLIEKRYPDGSSATFAYDLKGRLVRAANQHISYAMTYDAAGRLLSTTDSNGRTISYQYNGLGDRVKMVTPEGKEVEYSYDQANRLARIDSWAGSFALGYDSLGRRTKLTYPNGVTTRYSFDPLGNLIEILTSSGRDKKRELVSAFTYTHDRTGNRTTKTVLAKNELGTRYNYAYDPAYRLLESLPVKLDGKDQSQPQKAETFAYDPGGNRVAGPKATDSYVLNQGNQLLEGPKYRFQYDQRGNMVGKIGVDEGGESASWSYGYDDENQLVRVARMDSEGTKVTTFKYDPFGRRIEKREEEIGEEEGMVYTYVYDNEEIILELLSKIEGHQERTEITRYLHGLGIDEPLAVEQKGEIHFYHADGLGSITTLTDATGRVVQSYEYSSYGIPDQHGNYVKQPYTYTGREWDDETSLYFYRARYYDPAAGRFISKDPIGFGGGVNFYAYVQNNPINYTDPEGKQVKLCHRALGDSPMRLGPFHHTYLDVNGQLIGLHPNGIELNEKPGNDIKCGDPLKCVDDSCILQKAMMAPPSYYFGFYDCRAWAETIILVCHKKDCCEGN